MINWRVIQRKNFTSWDKLVDFLQLDPKYSSLILKRSHFPLNLPLRLAQKIEKNTVLDPIFRQFVPLDEESKSFSTFSQDPVKDRLFQKSSRLLQKYQGRALLLTTSACVMHCRYCFRKNYPYETHLDDFQKEINMIQQDSSLKEIILSGGDPLSLSDLQLSKLFHQLENILHLKRLRIHTRFPIGIPERIDDAFLEILKKVRLQVFFVIHVNHSKELDEDVLRCLKKIQYLGIPVLNQTVLLKGVNDEASILKELFEKLVDHGIMPYYLHQLDRVQGSYHFEVSIDEGKELIHNLKKTLSGYAIPKYVLEIVGESSKTCLMSLSSSHFIQSF